MHSCSTEELLLENELNNKIRDYSYEEITFQDLKKINDKAFIEVAKLKEVVYPNKSTDKNIGANYDIDLQSIRYIKRKNNDETFSFRIYQVPNATFQQNIIVECKKNEKPKTYLITYYLNKQVNQINNSNDFINSIKSTSIIKIDNQFKSGRTTIGGCLQVGCYSEVELCQGNLDNRPRCYNSDGTRATIRVFNVIESACSTGGVSDFIPLASQWNQYNTSPSNPYSETTGSTSGGGGAGESTGINIYAPNYFGSGDLNDPAVQNMLQINQFISTLCNSSNEIKGVIDNTEWLLAYTNYWIGSNGGLSIQNQLALTYAFNNMPTLFNQYYGNSYEPTEINNFKFSAFQFLLFHGEFLSNLDPTTQKSILESITSLKQIELINNIVNFMIENPAATYFDAKDLLISKAIVNSINDSGLNPCAKGVFDKVKNTTNYNIAQVLAKLNASKSIYNTTLKSEVTSNGNPATTFPTSRFNYTIQISTNYAGKTKLFIANSLIHAYFLSIVDDYKSNPNNNQNLYNLNSFPSLFQAYCDKKYPPAPGMSQNLHHLEMANYYVDAIARALQEFQTGIPVAAGESPQQIYSDLAWGGLNRTPIFDATYPVGNPNRQRIINRVACEQNGTTIGAGTPNAQTPIGNTCD
ncbi:hypothetical protein IWX83_000009 [Flavobacterium sp. CG_9.1]|uniref:hypothetical protein n=1 Tax=Flavobacterium sp. CG_9.1 TaxID=2787728 RepID=UPI0018CA2E79|nr:hypothetical protein [Flavobacterium sp. CG_9.1]MBG6060246.1 hypothetical protein [Flavobacterium sp. CG_9.1]